MHIARGPHLLAAAIGVTACAPGLPPDELIAARTAYHRGAGGPSVAESPAQLRTAKRALDAAERAYAEDGDTQRARDMAYVALRKAEIAEASARVQLARNAKMAAEVEAQRLEAARDRRATAAPPKGAQRAKTDDAAGFTGDDDDGDALDAQALAALAEFARVTDEPRGTVIALADSVLFAPGGSDVSPRAEPKLDAVARALAPGEAKILVEGHTDSRATREDAMQLSQRRADAVKAQLVRRGVAAGRIETRGVGPDRPVANNTTAAGRANNRRVEVVVLRADGD